MSLIGSVTNLPMANGARLSLAAFPRLQKIAPRSNTIQTSRLRELAARVNVVLPDDSNTSESAREEWARNLPMLTRCITTKAIGFLSMAHDASTPEAWSDAVAALGADGRFQVDYMAEQRQNGRNGRVESPESPSPKTLESTFPDREPSPDSARGETSASREPGASDDVPRNERTGFAGVLPVSARTWKHVSQYILDPKCLRPH